VESGNPYIKAGEIAAISLRARRPERERRAGTRAKTFPLPARARASHPAAAQNRPRASQTSSAPKKRGFRSFPESQAEMSSVALRSQARLRAIDHKHDNLQPTGAAGPPGQGRNRALSSVASSRATAPGASLARRPRQGREAVAMSQKMYVIPIVQKKNFNLTESKQKVLTFYSTEEVS